MKPIENPYHIEIIGKAIGHAEVIGIEYAEKIEIDCAKGNIFEIVLAGDLELDIVNSMGGRYLFIIKQDHIGSRTLTFESRFKFSVNDPGDISALANSINLIDCVIDPGRVDEIYAAISPNYT